MKKLVTALCLVLLAAAAASAADVINGCYQKGNGQFRVLVGGDRCGPSEVTVSLRSATDTEGLNPEIRDANGQFLGVGQADTLYIPSLRKWARIDLVDATGDLSDGQLLYPERDCGGAPYAEYEYLHWVFGNGQPGARRYYTAAPEFEPGVIMRSYRADDRQDCENLDFDYTPSVSKAVEVTLPFTTPVAFPTKIVGPKTGLAGRLRR